MNIKNLLNKNYNVSNKTKMFSLITCAVIVIALIIGVIFGVTKGSPFNLTTDFRSSYVIEFNGSVSLEEKKSETTDIIKNIITSAKYNDDDANLKVIDTRYIGTSEYSTVYINYGYNKLPKDVTEDTFMNAVNNSIEKELNHLFSVTPLIENSSSKITVTYETELSLVEQTNIKNDINNIDSSADVQVSNDNKIITINNPSQTLSTQIESLLTNQDVYSYRVNVGSKANPNVNSADNVSFYLLLGLITAIFVVYAMFRLDLLKAIVMLCTSILECILILALMTISHAPISVGLMTIGLFMLIYSMVLKFIILTKLKSLVQSKQYPKYNASDFANHAFNDLLKLNVVLFATGIIASILFIAIPYLNFTMIGIPLLFGVIVSTFSSCLLVPAIWTQLSNKYGIVVKTKRSKVRNKVKANKNLTNNNQ